MKTATSVIPTRSGWFTGIARNVLAAAFAIVAGSPHRRTSGSSSMNRPETIELDEGPRDCFLILDVSPSMLDEDWPPTRLAAAQNSAKQFAETLRRSSPDSSIALIAYGGTARVQLPLTLVRNEGAIVLAIDSMKVCNCTNIHAGLALVPWLMGNRQRTTQIVVLSDGHHNKGPSPLLVADQLKYSAVIETVGIGGRPQDVGEALLKAIASKRRDGTPRYRWIGDADALVKHFDCLARGLTRT